MNWNAFKPLAAELGIKIVHLWRQNTMRTAVSQLLNHKKTEKCLPASKHRDVSHKSHLIGKSISKWKKRLSESNIPEMRITYEQLLEHTEAEIRNIYNFLGVPWASLEAYRAGVSSTKLHPQEVDSNDFFYREGPDGKLICPWVDRRAPDRPTGGRIVRVLN